MNSTGKFLSDMQVFVPYPSPIDVAKCLDHRRLRKQIIECDQILKAIRGESEALKNHPVVKMYTHAFLWLWYYRETLDAFLHHCPNLAEQYSYQCDTYFRPPFLPSSHPTSATSTSAGFIPRRQNFILSLHPTGRATITGISWMDRL